MDDLGEEVTPPLPARRVVSLVPSLTEAMASVRPEALVGATDWCTHPADLAVTRVRGTKNPDLRAVVALRPDLVVANREENREIDVRRLRDAGLAVWVTDIESLDDALASLERLFRAALGWPVPAWLADARQAWSAPGSLEELTVATAIWRDPWMVVGAPTFADDIVRRLGATNPFADREGRYPSVGLDELRGTPMDVLLLPDEPYPFSAVDGPEAFPGTATALISGRLLTWYGPSLVSARTELEAAIRRAHTPSR